MAAPSGPISATPKPIKFGTDGWRGIIAADFTFERVAQVAAISAHVLHQCFGAETGSRTVAVGYDRRFLAAEFARTAAEAIAAQGFDVLLSQDYAPTPAFSYAAKHQNLLGAIVITASHNPPAYSGLKIKGAFGGSVSPEVTQQVEALLPNPPAPLGPRGSLETFDPWPDYCAALQAEVDVAAIQKAISSGKLTVFADVMYGSASGGLSRLLGEASVHELHSSADPLFGGNPPEPLPKYLGEMLETVKEYPAKDSVKVGLVFDGDSDRIAAVDGQGSFLSSQILIPILIDHLKSRRGYSGEIVKTISGSNLIPAVAQLNGLDLYQTAVGYKYIADRMQESQVLLGGEESGGIGYGHHIPERDALMSALYVLEAVVASGLDLSAYYRSLQEKTGYFSEYDRIDLPLASMEVQAKLLDTLATTPPHEVAGKAVTHILDIDGYKLTLADDSWLLIRFSGTEPVLRLYSEAKTLEEVHKHLHWAKDWASSFG
ncbi:phosphoglucomutase/phosphomannomutase family protein [Leptolyngbya sp. KIOST-1]|uniref:phosphoglucomutase/phosphomannomutase family protein n=1 Tax=Leptolyngbya sp. KIOST-1 TaxID=1229172 RepID=UPI00068F4EA0|nr:phosphoglucomutase/phosphomannomutase family protein [Leptolyngbya sp. KIOST-1]